MNQILVRIFGSDYLIFLTPTGQTLMCGVRNFKYGLKGSWDYEWNIDPEDSWHMATVLANKQ